MKCSECDIECYSGQYKDDCNVCSGTGEGHSEYERCWNCHGTGTERVNCEEDDDDEML